MNNPFYIHTPRNIFGESLVRDSIHNPPYEIRSTLTGKQKHGESKNFQEAVGIMNKCFIQYGVEQSFAAGI